jgi:hypothetical protein
MRQAAARYARLAPSARAAHRIIKIRILMWLFRLGAARRSTADDAASGRAGASSLAESALYTPTDAGFTMQL